MFKEATLYSPVIRTENGTVSVVFADGHPGRDDPAYQRHRARIAKAALDHVPGGPVADVEYTEQEHELWRIVGPELRERHQRYACREFLDGVRRLDLPTDRLPQLGAASARLTALTGFRFRPAAGIVEMRDFYGSLADGLFQATQYIRHCSTPRFSPEPDMIHEVVGHGSALASDRLAAIYRRVGVAARRLESHEALSVLSRVFWFTLEYGLVREDGEVRACGASLLSSIGELDQFRTAAEIRPLDAAAMGAQRYRVEDYQPVLFCAESFDHLEEFLDRFLDEIVRGQFAGVPGA
ncbi:phenylalanine 4-monooxygenase [Micromonospora inyonensis]|uniref:Phenylalanine 4-hydroxylase n=1 Tax=Micromonospora inyonensis TaxID=47866 RepID=A0A1C6SNZ4_9ACTN|nr:phenylalanine 4-monooxygenase [Micromonospora inyonensis]SCL31009.1 Phenylalanine 4-hydroxylase [Micromonospora inyonensis]